MRSSKKLLVWPAWLALLASLALLLCPRPSQAAEVRKSERVEVPAGEVIDDALVALGQTVVIEGHVRGDTVAFARSVRVTGTIDGNLITAAEQVDITGNVSGSVLTAGQEVSVAGELGSQLYAAGQAINLREGLELSGDAMLAGAQLDIAGALGRDLYASAEEVDIDAVLARDLVLSGNELRVGGEVGRDLRAKVAEEQDLVLANTASIAGVTEVEAGAIADDSRYDDFGYWAWQLAMLAAALIFGLLAFYLAPGLFRAPRDQKWLRVAGIGLAGLILIPMASLLTAVTIIGLPLAVFAMGAYVLAIYLGKLVIATELGRRVLNANAQRRSQVAWSLLLGLVLVTVLVELPVVGGVFGFIVAVLGLGSVTSYLLDRRKRTGS